jgi:hypothetical protein
MNVFDVGDGDNLFDLESYKSIDFDFDFDFDFDYNKTFIN